MGMGLAHSQYRTVFSLTAIWRPIEKPPACRWLAGPFRVRHHSVCDKVNIMSQFLFMNSKDCDL